MHLKDNTKNPSSMSKQHESEKEIVPNTSKSVEGEWYEFKGKYKLEKIKQDPDPDAERGWRHKAYRLTIHFPRPPIEGIHKKEIAVVGDDYGMYGYQCFDQEAPKEMIRLAEIIRDQKREINLLKQRNRKLERHFSKTAWDEEQALFKDRWETHQCDYCNETIEHKKMIEGKDFIYLNEGEIMHLECAIKMFNSICNECGCAWERETIEIDDEDNVCPECGGQLRDASKDEMRKHLQFDAIIHYLPKELQQHVTYKTIVVDSKA